MTLPCADMKVLMHGHLDGELDAANSFEVEGHLRTCPACGGEYQRLQVLRVILADDGIRYRAPDALRVRILEAIEPAPTARAAPAAGF